MVRISKPFITNADNSPAYWQTGVLWQVMATGTQTDNAFCLLHQVMEGDGTRGPVTHSHTQEEGLYVISGKCTFNAGGYQGLQGTPGTFVSIPGDTEHSFTVDEPNTEVLNFYLPAGFEHILIGIARPALERVVPPPELFVEMLPPPWLAEKLSEDYGQKSILGNPFIDKPEPKKMLTRPLPGATIFPFTAKTRELENYTTMGGCWTILANGLQTGGSYCLFEVLFRKGLVIPPRKYTDKDEMFYVFEREMTFMLEDQTFTVKKGSMVYIPSGHVYSVRVDSETSRCLNLHTRSGFEDLIILNSTRGESPMTAPTMDFEENEVDSGVRERLLKKIGLVELSQTLLI